MTKLSSLQFLMAILMVLGISTRAVAEDITWIDVSTADEFASAVKSSKDGDGNYNPNIHLTNEIDLSTLTPETSSLLFDCTFSGRIDGKYVNSQGQEVCGVLKNSKVIFFDKLLNATVSDVVLLSCYFDGWDTESGQFSPEAKDSHFTNVILAGCSSLGKAKSYDCDQMGGLIGIADNCTFTKVMAFNTELKTDGQSAGLLVGEAINCYFDQCATNFASNIWADGNSTTGIDGNAYAGGICGYATGGTFVQCVNMAMVSSDDDRIGGIVGYTSGTTLIDCKNSGIVCHNDEDGYGKMKDRKSSAGWTALEGIAGIALVAAIDVTAYFVSLSVPSLLGLLSGVVLGATLGAGPIVVAVAAIAGCVWLGYTIALAMEPDEMGGIAGAIYGDSKVIRCSNYGPVDCYDAYCGGLVGYADGSSIEACLNQGFVTAQEEAGGIVGYINDCTVRNNLNMCVASAEVNTGMIDGSSEGTNNCGNNYFLDRKNEAYNTCKAVTQDKLASGEVTLALNAGITSDAGQETIAFRQDLGTSIYPTLDTSADVVTATTNSYDLWQKVSTANEFVKAITNLTSKIELTKDIDLTDNYQFCLFSKAYPFCGEIKGNGHVIKNMTYQAHRNRYSTSLPVSAALFSYADKAKFENFTLKNFQVTQEHDDEHAVEAILVANSSQCSYQDISLQDCSITVNSSKDYLSKVGGLVACSTNDTFQDCSTDSGCRFEAYTGSFGASEANVGGITATVAGSVFRRCHNAASLYADDDNVGGIASYVDGGTLEGCLNSGEITAQEYVGGIAGRVTRTSITKCVNLGTIKDDENTKEEWRAGIVGCMTTSGEISDCINFGEVEYPGSDCGAIDGSHESAVTYGSGNYYLCQYDGKPFTNMSDALQSQISSGAYAQSKGWLYQSIDNDPYFTRRPVPIPAAGTVYSNVLCDASQTQRYSNYFHAAKGHATTEFAGICSLCGKQSTVPATIDISSASELKTFAQAVNSGVDYSDSRINLTCDIDMQDVSDFIPIGLDRDHPFRGIFNGAGHRIKNLILQRTNDAEGTGIFGCVSGHTTIYDLIVDASCNISAQARGTAGLVGCLISPDGSTDAVSLTLKQCGNEANVSGSTNAAGLVGGVYYNNTNSNLYIYDCFNTGYVSGTKESASLIGWGGDNLDIKRCFNTSSASGTETDHSAIRYNTGTTAVAHFSDVYQLEDLDNDVNAEKRYLDDFDNGTLCNQLNSIYAPQYVWSQNLGTQIYPQLSAAGIRHERTISNTWGTVVLPYAITSNADYQLYEAESCDVSAADGKLTLKPVDQVAANTPCFFRKLDDSATSVCFSMGSGTFTYTDDDPASIVEPILTDAGWSMVGSYDALSGLTGIYYLAQDKLWYADEAINLPAYRDYMTHVDQKNPCKSLSLLVLDDEGEVDEIVNINADGDEGPCYNLSGQRVSPTTRGIVIRGGQKILNK